VSLSEVEGVAGPPWERELSGRVDSLVVESELLSGNPLGDSTRRPLYVYLPPGYDDSGTYTSIYVIQGYTGQVDMWFGRSAFEPNIFERVDELFADGSSSSAIVVFVDAWTSYGGSQFINSIATGPYMDYLCDEVVPFVDSRYATAPDRDRRALTGKSSGGYGAMVVPMLRPDVFGAFAAHAGDALFEVSCLPEFRTIVRVLRDHFDGSYDLFFERFSMVLEERGRFDFERFGHPLEIYAYAACYSPDPENRGRALLPFELDTGRLVPDVWEQWLEWDPVRMAPRHLDALRTMRRIYLDAGNRDEPFLDLGAQAFSNELTKGGVEHSFELFDGGHGGIAYRYPRALEELAEALAE
jgi:enterochelin esterase-like enzyme